jgi:hypothetical protein
MMRFIDGPAAGVVLTLRRAPILIRAVFNGRKQKEQWDALDQPDDVPSPHEKIYLYIAADRPQSIHLSRRPRTASGWFWMGTYKYLQDAPPDEVLFDNEAYSAWCMANKDRLMPEWAR